MPQLEVILTSPRAPSYLAASDGIPDGTEILITSRVDSDDGSSTDFVARVQAYVEGFITSGKPALLLNFARGYKLQGHDGTLRETWNPHSPHLTLFERIDPSRPSETVQSGNHGLLQERHPLHVDAGPPAWLQVLHDGNVSNRVSKMDVEIPPAELNGRFVVDPLLGVGEPAPAVQPEDAGQRAVFRQQLEEALLDWRGPPHRRAGS